MIVMMTLTDDSDSDDDADYNDAAADDDCNICNWGGCITNVTVLQIKHALEQHH